MFSETKLTSTQIAYLLHTIYEMPIHVFVNISLPYILYHEMYTSAFILASLNACRPVGSILSSILGIVIDKCNLQANRSYSYMIATILFLFCMSRLLLATTYVFNSVWILLFSVITFYTCTRISSHFWIELLRRYTLKTHQQLNYFVATTHSMSYAAAAILSPLIGWIMDVWPLLRGTFLLLVSIISICFLVVVSWPLLLVNRPVIEKQTPNEQSSKLKPLSINPFAAIIDSMQNKTFLLFSIIFLILGAGIQIVSPLYSVYFHEANYSNIWIGIFRGAGQNIGVALGLRLGPKISQYFDQMFFIIAIAASGAILCFYFLLLSVGIYSPITTWIIFSIYGICVGVQEYIWLMSPVWFSTHDSIPISRANAISLGIRGIMAPFFGALLHYKYGISATLAISMKCFLLPGAILSGALYWKGNYYISMQEKNKPPNHF